MTIVGRIALPANPNGGLPQRRQNDGPPAEIINHGASRALVAIVQPCATTAPSQRPAVAFLAQLIANDRKLPQTREKRRIEPDVGAAAYAATAREPRFNRQRTICSL
jgi:hypothetical protein